MPDTVRHLRYWIEQTDEYPLRYHENGELTGLYIKMLRLLEDDSVFGCELEQITRKDGVEISAADALDMLETGELDIVLGLPEGLSNDLISFPVYDNVMTAIINKKSPDAGPVENCYWGIDSALIELTEGTRLEDHVLDYNGSSQLFEALDSKLVYGILIKRSLLDNYVRRGVSSDFREFKGIKLPYTDSVYISKNAAGTKLFSVLDSISEQLRDEYREYSIYNVSTVTGVGGSDVLAPYYNKLSDAYAKAEVTSVLAYVGISAAVLLAVLSAWLFSRFKRMQSVSEAIVKSVPAIVGTGIYFSMLR